MTLEHARRQKRDYSPADHERFVDTLVKAFGPDFFARTADGGLDTCRPVFLFGLPRSGTTLIEQVLASHSQIHGAGELRIARQTFEAIPTVLGRKETPVDCLPFLDAAAIHRLAQQHHDRLVGLADDRAQRIVDKMPDNYLYLGLLAAMFPRAAFLHCRRDMRDVAVSCWMTDFRSIRWASDPAAHRIAILPIPTDHGSLARRLAGRDPRGGLRGGRGRSGGCCQTIGGCLRIGLGARLSGVPPHAPAGSHRQCGAGSPAGIPAVCGALEPL